MQVIRRVIDALGAKTYLEIGVFDGTCFCEIDVDVKVGVDPVPAKPLVAKEIKKPGARYFAETSDTFFEQHANETFAHGVDVVFIDGLHTYAQAYRDCINALKYLSPRGLILLHDCLPNSELEARVAESYEDAIRLNSGVTWNGWWMGDVWKAILRLRAEHADLKTYVLNCDHGVGLVYRAPNDSPIPYSLDQIEAMTFADMAKDRVKLLDLRKPSEITTALDTVSDD